MNEKLTRDIINTRNIIKQKLKNLRLGALHRKIELQSQYKPIIKSLKDIAVNLPMGNIKEEVKSEPKNEVKENEDEVKGDEISEKTLLGPKFLDTNVVAESMDEGGDDDDVFIENQSSMIEGRPSITREDILNLTQQPSFREYLDQYDPLPRQYVEEMVTDDKDSFDFKYGVRHDIDTDKFFIGDSELKIVGKDIVIQDLKYVGTPGLYELLFKKEPSGYTETDRKNYADIVKRTNAARRHYSDSEQISGSRSQKYISIIAPMLDTRRKVVPTSRKLSSISKRPSSTSGGILALRNISSISKKSSSTSGAGYLKQLTKKRVEYVYWDNVNELVDRLRLLIASRNAGHTGHDNEIISIIEELKEAGIIE